jgi:hypothetical protein
MSQATDERIGMSDSTFKINPGESRTIGALLEERAVKYRMAAESNEGEHAAVENAMALAEADRLDEIATAFKGFQTIRVEA